MAAYNGHRSWNAWNVSLWISNDEPLYRFALECLRRPTIKFQRKPTLAQAVHRFMLVCGGQKTPDGATYNATSVEEALQGLES